MKKIIIIIIASVFLTACNISNSNKTTIDEYYLTINNVDIKPNMFINVITSMLGEYNDIRTWGLKD